MMYMVCPTCHNLLGDKQIYFETELSKICKDCEMGKYTPEEEFNKKKELVNSLGLKRYCCKQRLITYVKVVEVVK